LETPKIPVEGLLNKAIKILTSEKASINTIGLKLQLSDGKILQGKILNILPKKKAMISIDGEKLIASFPDNSQKRQNNQLNTEQKNSFKPGNKIYVKVEKIKPSPVFKLISPIELKKDVEGYIENISSKTKNKIVKLNDFKVPLYKSEPDRIVNNTKEPLSVSLKFESNSHISKLTYRKNENLKLLPIINLTPSNSENTKQKEYFENFLKITKPVNFNLPIIRSLKLSSNKIIPVKILNIVDKNTLSVQFKGQNFFLKNDYADLYKPGVTVRVQIQIVRDVFEPILLDPPNNSYKPKDSRHIPYQENNNRLRFIQSFPIKNSDVDSNIQTKPYKEKRYYGNKLLDSKADIKKIGLETIKPYLPSKKAIGKLITELKLEILESPILKDIPIKSEFISRFKNTIQQLTPKLNPIFSGGDIKRQVDISGVNYEAKLKKLLLQPKIPEIRSELGKDLKGQLLELKQITDNVIKTNLERNINRQIIDFQQKIKVAVDSIELNQLSSRLSNQENQPLLLQIPNPINSNDKTINLFVRNDSNENKGGIKSDKDNYNLAFFLELSELGNIKMNVDVCSNSMKVRMDIERDDVVEFVLNNSTDFKNSMKNKGFSTTVECCNVKKISPIKDNLTELLVSNNTSLFSVKT